MLFKAVVLIVLAWGHFAVGADTYKCTQGGKTVFSDIPCAAGANKVDQSSDKVSRESRYQAEYINQKNSRQLSELEYQAARDKAFRGGTSEVPASLPPASRQRPTYRYR
jgi:hypothetical protein